MWRQKNLYYSNSLNKKLKGDTDLIKLNIVIVIIISSLLIFLSCNDSEVNPFDSNQYPTTLQRLNENDQESIQERLNRKLGSKYKALLNQFGILNDNLLYNEGTSSILDQDSVITIAKETVLYLSEFNNVTDTSDLKIKSVVHYKSSWLIIFDNQFYQGLEILDTDIQVLITDSILEISGHHFSEVFIPHIRNFIKKDVITNIWNEKIEYSCRGGGGTVVVNDESIMYDEIKTVIFPFISSDYNSLALHVVWKIPIEVEHGERWEYFIDVVSGKVVALYQNFRC